MPVNGSKRGTASFVAASAAGSRQPRISTRDHGVLDLDGVIWLGPARIPGAAEAVAELRADGERVAVRHQQLLRRRPAEVEAKLATLGIPADGDVVTSAQACATLVAPGERVLVCRRAGRARGGRGPAGPSPSTDSTSGRSTRWSSASTVRSTTSGCGWRPPPCAAAPVCSPPTTTPPIPTRGRPDPRQRCRSSPAIAAGRRRRRSSSPASPTHRWPSWCAQRYGADGWMVGDRPDTDGRLAASIGYRFALVLSGVTTPADLPVVPEPSWSPPTSPPPSPRSAG